MSTKKFKAVLIMGYDIEVNPSISRLYKKKETIVIGGDRDPVVLEDLEALRNRIDYTTRIDLYFHGHIKNGVHHIGFTEKANLPTAYIFRILNVFSSYTPLQVHLWSCYGGAANVSELAEGSVLFSHIPSQYAMSKHLADYAILRSLQALLADSHKPLSQLGEFINCIHFNLLQTASISTYIGSETHKLVLEPTLFEVMTSPDQVIEEAVIKVSNFTNAMRTLAKLKLEKQISNDIKQISKLVEGISIAYIFSLNGLITKTLYSEEKKELRIGYLEYFCAVGNAEAIQLVAKNALSNLQAIINQDINHMKPLTSAISMGRIDVTQTLLDSGADVNDAIYKGRSALFSAVYNNDTDMVKMLVSYCANVNIADSGGSTPLHIAAMYGNLKIVQTLVGAKANLHFVSSSYTPLDVAKINKHKNIIKFLEAAVNAEQKAGIEPYYGLVNSHNCQGQKLSLVPDDHLHGKLIGEADQGYEHNEL